MEQMTTKRPAGLSSLELKLLAMGTMLVDHIGWGFFPMELWLRGIGRLAFPIFAFQAAEGWARSHDRRRYLLRMALFALLSELPFDLLFSGQLWNAGEQNVLWTFTIALGCLWAAEWLQRRGLPEVLALLCVAVPGYLLGQWLAVDYYGGGVLMVLVFALCRDKKWRWPVELAAMLVINGRLLPSAYIELGGTGCPSNCWLRRRCCPSGCTGAIRGPITGPCSCCATAFIPSICCCWLCCCGLAHKEVHYGKE